MDNLHKLALQMKNKEEIELHSLERTGFAISYSWTRASLALQPLLSKHKKILDIGCEWRRNLKQFPQAVGVDSDKEVIEKARKLQNGLMVADTTTLPFKDGSFDSVLLAEVIGNIPAHVQYQIIKEVKRIIC